MKLLAIICSILVALSASQVFGQVTRGNSGWASGIPNTTPKAPQESETTTRGSSGWASGIPNTTPKVPQESETTTIYYPPQKPQRPCGPNDLGDYKGGCDDSVPVIVMPKGRPIMESVLDWFKSCLTN